MPTFCKEERLCNKNYIFLLQNTPLIFFCYPFTVKWMEISEKLNTNVQILPAVPKRNFKKAVDRNYIKRLIREAYRNNKEILLPKINEKEKSIVMMLLYSGKKAITYHEAETKIVLILQHIAENL
jgi:ribonuclease P protein component